VDYSPHVPFPVTEWVVIVVYELPNILKMVVDDLKIHQTFPACLTLKNTLNESVSKETKIIFVQKLGIGLSIGGHPLLQDWVGLDPGTPTIDAYDVDKSKFARPTTKHIKTNFFNLRPF
jgi:hypothetical protein